MPRRHFPDHRSGFRIARALSWILLAGLGSGCGGLISSPSSDPGEVAELKREIVELQRRATVSEIEAERLREEVADLERQLAEARRQAPAETDRQDPGRDTRIVEEPIETSGPISVLGKIEQSELDEEPYPEEPAPGPERTAAGDQPTPQAPPSGNTGGSAASDQAIALYDAAYALFHQAEYSEAERTFKAFLLRYPDTDLADNAQFWVGESQYARGDYNAALSSFTETVESFPEGNKVPDALLKAGKCLEALDRPGLARQTYLEVTDRFPTSTAAAAARERLAALQ